MFNNKFIFIFVLASNFIQCSKDCESPITQCSDSQFIGNWQFIELKYEYLNDSLVNFINEMGILTFRDNHSGKGAMFLNSEFEWFYDCSKMELLMFKFNTNRNANNYYYFNFKVDFINGDKIRLFCRRKPLPQAHKPINSIEEFDFTLTR